MNVSGARLLQDVTRRWLLSPRFLLSPFTREGDIALAQPSVGRNISDFAEGELGAGSVKPVDILEDLRLSKITEYKLLEASEVLTKALGEYATLADLLAMASRCESSLGRQIQAADLAVAGLTIDPDNDHAWFVAIQSLRNAGKAREARSGCKLTPDRARVRLGSLGVSEWGRSDPALAFLGFQTRDPVDLAYETAQGETLQTKGSLRSFARWKWRTKDFGSALDAYKKLIRLSLGSVVPLLLTRSFCLAQLKENRCAAMDISAALALDPGHDYQTRMEILDARQRILEAMSLNSAVAKTVAFRESHLAKHRKKRLREDGFELEEAEKKKSTGLSINKGKTNKDEAKRAFKILRFHTVEDLKRVDAFVRRMPPEKRSLIFDDRVPRFHDEYDGGPHLEHSNHSKCMSWLTLSYGESISSPKTLNVYRTGRGDECEKNDMLQGLPIHATRECIEWWENTSIGDVRKISLNRRYPPGILHSFSNVPRSSIELQFGKTHVAVGYVDLGVLLFGKFVGDKEAGPVKFVGYEMSTYSTAKTYVLFHMLKNRASIDSVLPVGYSAGWSRETLDEFRQAARRVIEEISDLPASVKELVQHWSVVPEIDLKESQEVWLDVHDSPGCIPGNVMDRNDRMELVRYMLSGRILECSVGSAVMFGNPSHYPRIARNEYAFWTIDEKDLGLYHKSCGSIMSVVATLLQERIRALREHVIAGRVEIDLKLRMVLAHDDNVIEEIRELSPWTISWSNLCDHMAHDAFRFLAKACSVEGTIHHAHSMNWLQDVKGTWLVDYPSSQVKLDMAEICREECSKAIDRACGRDILLTPPIMDPRNMIHSVCKDFYGKWLNCFLGEDVYVGAKRLKDFSLFASAPANLHFCFTYDKILATEGWRGRRDDGSLSASLSRPAVSE
ncbi:hypothetical protein BSKO_12854 [Bryopsis sp. KO-2023]|nr:hypothetical protein BSKO_12854 [Bryopsis sp. KO-2023]